jgi:hypothetical protein
LKAANRGAVHAGGEGKLHGGVLPERGYGPPVPGVPDERPQDRAQTEGICR